MKRFDFKLERLERLREIRERQARAELAGALARMRAAEQHREETERAYLAALRGELPPAAAGEPRAWRDRAAVQAACRAAMKRARRDAEHGRQACAEVARRHTEAAQDHRALERLHERRFRRWLEQVEHEGQKFLDEVHLLRVVREREDPEEAR